MSNMICAWYVSDLMIHPQAAALQSALYLASTHAAVLRLHIADSFYDTGMSRPTRQSLAMLFILPFACTHHLIEDH